MLVDGLGLGWIVVIDGENGLGIQTVGLVTIVVE